MKKIYVILFTVFLNATFFSCTPENIIEGTNTQATECCGENGDLDPPPPPPPPPPPTDGKSSQGANN